MIKTTIKETIEKYDKDGNLLEKIVREETTDDDENRHPFIYPNVTPYSPYNMPDSSKTYPQVTWGTNTSSTCQ